MTDTPPDAALLARIIEAVPGGVVHVGPDGAIHRANAEAMTFLGLGFDALTGSYTVDFDGSTYFEDGSPCPVEEYPVTRCIVTGEPQGPTTIGVEQPGGSVRWALFRAIPGPGGGAVVTFVDITERLEQEKEQEALQQQLQLADRLASVGTLAAGVAHEVNNPLTYVIGNLDIAVERVRDADPKTAKLLEEALDGAMRVARIVASLRKFARTEALEIAPFDIVDALNTAIRIASPEFRTTQLVFDLPPDPVIAQGDHGRAVQVFLNVLMNASHAVRQTQRSGRVEVSVDRQADRIDVVIRDDGVGMDQSVLRRARDPFFTTKPAGAGSGLGLSITDGLMTRMDGQLDITSVPGEHTRVVLSFAAASTAPTSAPSQAAAGGVQNLRILLVDDEQAIRNLCTRILGPHNQVTVAEDGEHALVAIRRAPFDAVLCDLIMPVMSGMQLHEAVAEEDAELAKRFVFTTGAAYLPQARRFVEETAQPVLFKPFRAAQLHAALQSVLGSAD